MTTATRGARRSRPTGAFIATKEHRRFTEFADAVRRDRYIGLCFGPAGVGKTISARRYANWDSAEQLLEDWGPRQDSDARVYAALARSRSVFYTPTTTSTHRQIDADLNRLVLRLDSCIDEHHATPGQIRHGCGQHAELLIIDEADRLNDQALEHIRDRFDRRPLGLLLIGMPGIEKRLARHPQLFSRIGFAHPYRPLTDDELAFVLSRHWKKLGLTLDLTDFTDAQAVAAIRRITRGNFRLLHRLFTQITRIMRINNLNVVTSDVVESAGSTLVTGDT